MIIDRVGYENIDDKPQPATESVYTNPVFDDDDDVEDNARRRLLSDALSDALPSSETDEQSPYEEVAVNVSNTDDPTMLCVTFRSVFIAVLLTCVTAFTVQFFAYRTSPLDVNIGIVLLVSYVIGKLMASTLPKSIFNITINPGPFTVKEHALITIMATSGSRTYEAMEALTIQRLYYKYYLGHLNSLLFLLIMHFLAISISGILNRYLIWPAAMVWPKTLMSCSLIRTLIHEDKYKSEKTRWTMSRSKFFWLIVLCQFVYYWLPGYIFPLLSFFSLVCMIAPNNIVFSQVTGANGLGLGAFEFDWNAWVAFLDSPILVPFWAHVNMFVGFICVIWIATPIIYYSDIWDSKKAPIISNRVFDEDGAFYDTQRILDGNLRLNRTAFEIYGKEYLTAGYAVSFGFMFAGTTALIVHTILYHGTSIVEQFRSSLSDKNNDIHAKLMSHYPVVPEFIYYATLYITVVIAVIFCYYTELLPPTIILLSVVLIFVFVLPSGIITAITNMTLTTTIAGDYLISLILPGNPIGFLTFRTYTNICQNQILVYLTSLKIGHYMKIPPRIMLLLLVLSAMISSVVHYFTALYLLDSIPHICTRQNRLWKCLNAENTYTSSVIFGIVGSFNPGSRYFPLLIGLPIGILLPIISWCLWKRFPNIKWLALVNFPILLMATNNLPPAPTVEFPSWFIVGFIFNYVLYRHAHHWWEKYAYIFSAAMSCGVAICGFVIFFVLETHGIAFPEWWGLGTATGDGCPLASANYSGAIPIERDF